jgi:hypothetical protein
MPPETDGTIFCDCREEDRMIELGPFSKELSESEYDLDHSTQTGPPEPDLPETSRVLLEILEYTIDEESLSHAELDGFLFQEPSH